MRGRKPTPTALKIVKGNPGRRPLNKHEPKAKRGVPPKPAWLKGVAVDCWTELCILLNNMQVLTLPDGPALALLCATYEDYRTARDAVEDHGQTYESETEHGVIIRARPEVMIMSDAAKRLRALMVEFGLTPSARSRVKADNGVPEDPLDSFLGGGRSG